MFWADEFVSQIKKRFTDKISCGEEIIVREENTVSGHAHIGSLRGIGMHGLIAEVLREKGIKSKFIFELNDFDPVDGLPEKLKSSHQKYMGFPLCNTPSPDPVFSNFAEFFASEIKEIVQKLGFEVHFSKLSKKYLRGEFDETIRLALEKAPQIREIYKKIAKSEKSIDWHPLQVICPKCGKVGTTKVIGFDGQKVDFICEPNLVSWAQGCGEKGKISPFKGNAKLPWKVEWAAKFKVYGVDVEGAGKDHYTKGGSRDIAKEICQQIFNFKNPFDMPHEFFTLGGKKMSSSKGLGATAKDVVDLLPREITRLLLFRKIPKKPIDFDLKGETIPNLFDEFDRLKEIYLNQKKDPINKKVDFARIFEVCSRQDNHYATIRFRDIAFLLQVPHLDFWKKITAIKGNKISENEKKEIKIRLQVAKNWLKKYAPEKFVFKIFETLPQLAKSLNQGEKKVIKEILSFFENTKKITGENLHEFLHSLKEKLQISPREIFLPIYKIFLGKDSGPKAGFLLSVLNQNLVKKMLKEAIEFDGGKNSLKEKKKNIFLKTMKNKIEFSDFQKLEIKVGTIVEVEKVKKAKKLYKLQVDCGEESLRQIVSSMVPFYSADEMLGKKITVLCNLKPTKFCGELSNGMLLAAEKDDESECVLLTVDKDIKNGTKVC